MSKILLVEDDEFLARSICDWLKAERHTVDHCADGRSGLDLMLGTSFDLIILDWELPQMSGTDALKQYRSSQGCSPVLFLTAKSTIDDKEFGLDAGADDYLTKPFHMRELSARIRALLRRQETVVEPVLSVGDISLNISKMEVRKDNKVLHLQPMEYALLEFFLKHKNQVFDTDALLNRVWSSDSESSGAALRMCINRLRKKIDNPQSESIIQNIHGQGYILKDRDV